MMLTRLQLFLVPALIMTLAACSGPSPRWARHHQTAIERSELIRIARAQLGTDYKYGGDSPAEGFDCSGLVYYSFHEAGVSLPRTAYGQLKRSLPVSRRHLKRGDLVFFRVSRSRISHVGIYLGHNRFIHAPSSGKTVSIASLNNPYWKKRFIRAGRIPALQRASP